MTDYSEIIKLVDSGRYKLVYISIGCAQGHYQYGSHHPQQYPACVAEWPGRKLCVLIDPCLENPPYAYRDVGVSGETGDIVEAGDVTFVARRHEFNWPSRFTDAERSGPHIAFLEELCQLAVMNGGPHVIVQDYAGNDIRGYYPAAAPAILQKKVLYDFTYKDSGCFVDFSKVQLLQDAEGNFLQPAFSKLADISGEGQAYELQRRTSTILYAVLPLFQIQTGLKEPREWCTAERVLGEARHMFGVYGLEAGSETEMLRRLLIEFFFDLTRAAESYSSEGEIRQLIEVGGDGYTHAVNMLKSLVG